MAPAMDELQRLDDEFNFTNAATAKFDISFQILGRIVLDPALDRGNFVEQIRGGTAWINKWLMLPQEFVSELTTAGDAAGFDQRDSFPGFTESGVVIFHALQRAREWTRRALRAKPKIDAKERAFSVRGRKRLQNFFGEAIEPLMVG